MRNRSDEERVGFERSSGNVFADLGLPNPEERQTKAALMRALNAEIKRLGLNQTEAAERIGLTQPDVSRISHGQGGMYSVERIIEALRKLNINIEITLHRGVGSITVRELV